MPRRARILPGLCVLLVFALGVSHPVSAQPQPWPQPDGFEFSGICCDTADPTLPQFPNITQEVQYICWRDCVPILCRDVSVTLGAPQPLRVGGITLGCGLYRIPVTIGRGPLVLFTGSLIATYARTWLEDAIPDPAGAKEFQVWRMLVNGDLMPGTRVVSITNPCVPQCFRAFNNKIYWAGYIDYRNFCPDGTWEVEWAINHECDFFHHNSDSGRPAPAGGLHPRHSYNVVGPTPFVCTVDIPPSEGPTMFESVRSIGWRGAANFPPTCFREEPIENGALEPLQEFCICVTGSSSPQYVLTNFFGMSICGTSWGPGGDNKPFVQKKIGFWQDASGGPFKFLLLKQGDLSYADGCTGSTSIEYFEGVETIGGFPAFTLENEFLGLQSDDDGSSNFIRCETVKGIPHVVCKIISVNMP